MAKALTDGQRKLLEGKNLAYVATVGAGGNPQVTPVWIEYDGTHVCFNTEEKRAKTRRLREDPRVAICVANAENPYQYVEIRGKVVEITREGADAMINRLSNRYIGKDYPFNQPGDVRIAIKVEVESVGGMGA